MVIIIMEIPCFTLCGVATKLGKSGNSGNIRENQGILFSIRENQGKKKDSLKNQGSFRVASLSF